MSYCITHEEGPCFCLKARVKWCEHCQMWICRTMYPAHYCMTPGERVIYRAQRIIINKIRHRAYLMREDKLCP